MKLQTPMLILAVLASLIGCNTKQLPEEVKPGPSLRFDIQKLSDDYYEGSAIGDMDNDGDLDIVSGSHWYEAPGFKQSHLIRELGNAQENLREHNGDHLWDVNRDGHLDVVSGSFFQRDIRAYLNPASKSDPSWQSVVLGQAPSEQNEFFFDHSLDGQQALVGNSWVGQVPVIFWTLDEKEARLREYVAEGVPNGHGMGFGDMDGDGDEDLLFRHGWYERTESEWIAHKDWSLPAAGCPMLVVDLDADGVKEVIYGNGHGYGLHLLKRSHSTWEESIIDETFSQVHTLVWTDLDGDGENELVTGKRVYAHGGKDPGANESPVLYYYRWLGDRFERHLIHAGQAGTGLQIQTADLNGDGLAEIVVAGKTGAYLFWNRGYP